MIDDPQTSPPPSPQAAPEPQPLIIPRGEHTISRKLIDPEALKVLYRLRRFNHLAYLVGGGVRDILLGKRPKDFDVATDARPGELHKLFRNSRIIGRRFRLVQVFFGGTKIVEVSTFRRQSEFDRSAEGGEEAAAGENTFGSPAEDAFRRDITINALFYNVEDFTLVDYVGGLRDLREGVIRAIGPPRVRFLEDPVRMIRVVRHAARTGFRIEEETWRAVRELSDEVTTCSQSRVRDEFLRDLGGGSARPAVDLLIDSGLLFRLYPDYEPFLAGKADAQPEESRRYLLRCLDALDCAVAGPCPPSRPVLLAVFLLPVFETLLRRHAPPEGAWQPPLLQRLVEERLRPMLVRWAFFKRDLELVCQILALQPRLRAAAAENSLPGSLPRKTHYDSALVLFQLDAAARGERVPPLLARSRPELEWPLPLPRSRPQPAPRSRLQPSLRARPEPAPPSRPRRRRRRGGRKGGGAGAEGRGPSA